jgi:hypothetical protein
VERVAPWRLTSLGVPVRDASSIKPSSVTRFMSSQSLEKSQFQLINCIVRAAPGNPIKAKPFLASSEVSKCSPMPVDWQRMEIRPVGAILWSLLRKFPFVSLPRPTHLRTPPDTLLLYQPTCHWAMETSIILFLLFRCPRSA